MQCCCSTWSSSFRAAEEARSRVPLHVAARNSCSLQLPLLCVLRIVLLLLLLFSFLPQIWMNYQRKSCTGLSFEFQVFNIYGIVIYGM